MSPLLLKLVFDRMESGPMPFFVKPIARAIAGRAKNSAWTAQATFYSCAAESAFCRTDSRDVETYDKTLATFAIAELKPL